MALGSPLISRRRLRASTSIRGEAFGRERDSGRRWNDGAAARTVAGAQAAQTLRAAAKSVRAGVPGSSNGGGQWESLLPAPSGSGDLPEKKFQNSQKSRYSSRDIKGQLKAPWVLAKVALGLPLVRYWRSRVRPLEARGGSVADGSACGGSACSGSVRGGSEQWKLEAVRDESAGGKGAWN